MSLEISREQRFSLYAILARISRGRAIGDLGRLAEARVELAQGLEEARRNGVGFMLPMMESWLADTHAKAGDNEYALSIVEKALADIGLGRSWEFGLAAATGATSIGTRSVAGRRSRGSL